MISWEGGAVGLGAGAPVIMLLNTHTHLIQLIKHEVMLSSKPIHVLTLLSKWLMSKLIC